MNTTPILQGRPVSRGTRGRVAVENRARSGWASLLTKDGKAATVHDVTDLSALAREIRRSWP